jgi:hypothetical protein
MSRMTMTIAEIRSPAEGKQRGTLIGTNGAKIGVFREKASLFNVGGTYDIEVSDGDYQNVKSATPVTPPATASGWAAPAGANGHAANGGGVSYASNGNGGHHPTGNGATHQQPSGPHCAKEEQIFVQGVLQALIRAGEVKNEKVQLWHTLRMLRSLYKHGFDGEVE